MIINITHAEADILEQALNRFVTTTKADEHTAGPDDWRRYFKDLEKLRARIAVIKKRVDDET